MRLSCLHLKFWNYYFFNSATVRKIEVKVTIYKMSIALSIFIEK